MRADSSMCTLLDFWYFQIEREPERRCIPILCHDYPKRNVDPMLSAGNGLTRGATKIRRVEVKRVGR